MYPFENHDFRSSGAADDTQPPPPRQQEQPFGTGGGKTGGNGGNARGGGEVGKGDARTVRRMLDLLDEFGQDGSTERRGHQLPNRRQPSSSSSQQHYQRQQQGHAAGYYAGRDTQRDNIVSSGGYYYDHITPLSSPYPGQQRAQHDQGDSRSMSRPSIGRAPPHLNPAAPPPTTHAPRYSAQRHPEDAYYHLDGEQSQQPYVGGNDSAVSEERTSRREMIQWISSAIMDMDENTAAGILRQLPETKKNSTGVAVAGNVAEREDSYRSGGSKKGAQGGHEPGHTPNKSHHHATPHMQSVGRPYGKQGSSSGGTLASYGKSSGGHSSVLGFDPQFAPGANRDSPYSAPRRSPGRENRSSPEEHATAGISAVAERRGEVAAARLAESLDGIIMERHEQLRRRGEEQHQRRFDDADAYPFPPGLSHQPPPPQHPLPLRHDGSRGELEEAHGYRRPDLQEHHRGGYYHPRDSTSGDHPPRAAYHDAAQQQRPQVPLGGLYTEGQASPGQEYEGYRDYRGHPEHQEHQEHHQPGGGPHPARTYYYHPGRYAQPHERENSLEANASYYDSSYGSRNQRPGGRHEEHAWESRKPSHATGPGKPGGKGREEQEGGRGGFGSGRARQSGFTTATTGSGGRQQHGKQSGDARSGQGDDAVRQPGPVPGLVAPRSHLAPSPASSQGTSEGGRQGRGPQRGRRALLGRPADAAPVLTTGGKEHCPRGGGGGRGQQEVVAQAGSTGIVVENKDGLMRCGAQERVVVMLRNIPNRYSPFVVMNLCFCNDLVAADPLFNALLESEDQFPGQGEWDEAAELLCAASSPMGSAGQGSAGASPGVSCGGGANPLIMSKVARGVRDRVREARAAFSWERVHATDLDFVARHDSALGAESELPRKLVVDGDQAKADGVGGHPNRDSQATTHGSGGGSSGNRGGGVVNGMQMTRNDRGEAAVPACSLSSKEELTTTPGPSNSVSEQCSKGSSSNGSRQDGKQQGVPGGAAGGGGKRQSASPSARSSAATAAAVALTAKTTSNHGRMAAQKTLLASSSSVIPPWSEQSAMLTGPWDALLRRDGGFRLLLTSGSSELEDGPAASAGGEASEDTASSKESGGACRRIACTRSERKAKVVKHFRPSMLSHKLHPCVTKFIDFFHQPQNLKGYNLGYAFARFRSVALAERFMRVMNGVEFPEASCKVLELCVSSSMLQYKFTGGGPLDEGDEGKQRTPSPGGKSKVLAAGDKSLVVPPATSRRRQLHLATRFWFDVQQFPEDDSLVRETEEIPRGLKHCVSATTNK